MNELIINKQDLLHNIGEIKAQEKQQDYTLIAVVKGNAYGLGMVEFTKFLMKNGFHYFAVASFEEAMTLRKNGIQERILLLTPYLDIEIIRTLIQNDITLTVDSIESFDIIQKTANELKKLVTVHIKIDTGLSRYGFFYDDIKTISKIIVKKSNIVFEGIYSHFSNSLCTNSNFSNIQFARFTKVIEQLKKQGMDFKLKHICNSSGYFKYPNMHLNAARIGSAFIGYGVGMPSKLKKIGLFHTQIARIREVKKGDYIGYGKSYKAKKDMKIAILPTGYYDGIGLSIVAPRFRFLSKAKRIIIDIEQLFHGDKIYLDHFKVLGQIGMHDVVIDITNDNYRENDDIYFYIKPVLIESSVKRVYQ